jgi:hypothetical protein
LGKPFDLEFIFPVLSTRNLAGLREYPSSLSPDTFDQYKSRKPEVAILSEEVIHIISSNEAIVILDSSDDEIIENTRTPVWTDSDEEGPTEPKGRIEPEGQVDPQLLIEPDEDLTFAGDLRKGIKLTINT